MGERLSQNIKERIQQLHAQHPEMTTKEITLKVNSEFTAAIKENTVYYQMNYAGKKSVKGPAKVKKMEKDTSSTMGTDAIVENIYVLLKELQAAYASTFLKIRGELLVMVAKARGNHDEN
uniref:Uncharacterized protein n=1 Tax=viral metagenome TaxID=1070528 RepID=A0A6M3KJF3_9ZZZZ